MKRKNYWRIILLILSVVFISPSMSAMSQSISGADTANRLIRARAGDPQEQYLLGLMYEYGKGIAQSYTEAAHWYLEAAKQGHMRGQLSMGNLYDKGLGVGQSYKEALIWYLKAAEQGSAEAMYFIGSMTYNGEGTKADPQIAMQWFFQSGEHGLPQGKAAYDQLKIELAASPATPTPQTATATATTNPAAPSSSSKPAVKYAVQIGSFRTREQAQQFWANTKTKFPDAFAGAKAFIYKKTFESGKVFYRLNAAVFAQKSEANRQCARYKDKGTDCIIVKY